MESHYTIGSRVNDYVESHRRQHQKNYCRGLMKEPRQMTDDDCEKFLAAAKFLGREAGQWLADRSSLVSFMRQPNVGSGYAHAWAQLSRLIGYAGAANPDGSYDRPTFD